MSRRVLTYSALLAIASGLLLLLDTYVMSSTSIAKIGLLCGGGGTAVAWSLRRLTGEKRADDLVINLGVLGVTLIVLFILGEVATRLIFKDITSTGDNGSYFAQRWFKKAVRHNTLGFRERDFTFAKPEGTYRIAVVGDSMTFGQGIPEEDRFSNLLERYLKEKKKDVEVLNFGVPGANTIHEISSLRNVILKTNPDFILLAWYPNDVEGNVPQPEPVHLIPFQSVENWLFRSSALYYIANRGWMMFNWINYEAYVFDRFGDPESPDSREYDRTLNEFINLSQDQGRRLGIVLIPNLVDVEKDYTFRYLHVRVLRICAQRQIRCLDLTSKFMPYLNGRKLWVNRLDAHANSLANRLAAEGLIETFGEMWLNN